MIPSRRAGRYSREPRDRDHMVHHVQELTRAADREPLDRRDPQLLANARDAAEDLVDVAHVAHHVEQEVDPPVVEVGQVDPGAERPLAGVARMVDDAAAEHPDLDLGIEQDQVDGRLGLVQRVPVLGVEVARVAQLEHAGAAVASDASVAEVDGAGRAELVEALERKLGRVEHRLDQVAPGARDLEDLGEQQTLRKLDAFLVGELAGALLFDLGACRYEARDSVGRLVKKLLDPDRSRAPVGQRVVELLDGQPGLFEDCSWWLLLGRGHRFSLPAYG